ncbi:pseudouridine synthase [Candidatus Trichorickettsia mobilis]|uniref:pseudouridine synthase n=1 Tax=Candidatus Trichorickettsia mobilis TaxID=1346319 RepID=UPI00292E6C92|nr:pseudouridine synthase [Candidatus Trichorickettsia mobilis]
MQQRIAKAISSAGVCSRRQAELLIADAVVKVNNVLVTSPITFVNDDSVISINDVVIERAHRPRIWIYYKPVSLITTHHDPYDRDTVFDNLSGLPRVISVGRLDLNSEGLLLLTNNGALARNLELPSTKMERVYKVRAYGNCELLQSLSFPVEVNGVIYNPKTIKLIQPGVKNSWFEVVLTEGKNREIRKLFNHYGLMVSRLIRTQYGAFSLGDLKPGQYQEQTSKIQSLNFQEINL